MKGVATVYVFLVFACCPLSWGQGISSIMSYPLPHGPDFAYDHGSMAYADGRVWLPTNGSLVSVSASAGDVRSYSLPDGLPGETVLTLTCDAQGLLWSAVQFGESADGAICCFDGVAFSSAVELRSLAGLASGSDGTIWAIGDSWPCRLLRWNGMAPGDWTSYDLAGYGLPMNWSADKGLFVDQTGCVWFVGSGDLVSFCEGVLTVREMPGDLWSSYYADITADREGKVWWISDTCDEYDNRIGRLACYDHGEWRSYGADAFGVSYFTCLAEAPNGSLIAGSDRGLFLFDGDHLTRLGTEDALPFDWIVDVMVDPAGDLFVWCIPALRGSSLGALAKFDGQRVEVYAIEPHPLAGRGAPKAVDNEGRVWFVSKESGFSSFLRGEWEVIPLEPEILGWPLRVSHDGALWWSQPWSWPFPTEEAGIWRYMDGVVECFDDDNGLALDYCWDLEVDSKGVLWGVGGDVAEGCEPRQCVSRFDGSKWENRDDLSGMNDPWCFTYNDMAIDLDDSMWCAIGWVEWSETILGGGACHWDRSEVTYLVPPVGGRCGPRLGAAAVTPDGTRWFLKLYQYSGYGDDPRTGLVRFDGSDWFWKWSDEFGVAVNPPLDVDDLGRLWMSYGFGRDRGVLVYDPELDTCQKYKVADGLGSPDVNLLLMDADGNVWVDGNGAVSILLADGNIELEAGTDRPRYSGRETMVASLSWFYRGPTMPADLYVALQLPSGQLFYVAPQGAEPAFPIFYAAFEGSTEFLQPGPNYDGPGSIPNTPDMRDMATPAWPLPDPPQAPTGLVLFAYPVPYLENVPLPAYTSIDDVVLLDMTIPEDAPVGEYKFHLGITAPSSISNIYTSAETTFEIEAE
ncbi:MAG: hypothetical protein JW941_00095 [Candidatus Coatesbacteria bacterium]|nr:hypothetical protein [Candidatus Coatesbacteria bacterium]